MKIILWWLVSLAIMARASVSNFSKNLMVEFDKEGNDYPYETKVSFGNVSFKLLNSNNLTYV